MTEKVQRGEQHGCARQKVSALALLTLVGKIMLCSGELPCAFYDVSQNPWP